MGLRRTAPDKRLGQYPNIQIPLHSGEVKRRMNSTIENGELFQDLNSMPINTSCLEVVANWVEAIHGQGDLPHSLSRLVTFLNAKNGILCRFVDGQTKPKVLARGSSISCKKYRQHQAHRSPSIFWDST
jgi:hypothetical protein